MHHTLVSIQKTLLYFFQQVFMTYLNECIIYAIYYAEQSLIISRHLKVFENKGCKLQAQRGVIIEQDNNTQLHCMHQYQLGLQDKNTISTVWRFCKLTD